jgi:hypothetical protein
MVLFCRGLVSEDHHAMIDAILVEAGVSASLVQHEEMAMFAARVLHPVLHQHTRKLFI